MAKAIFSQFAKNFGKAISKKADELTLQVLIENQDIIVKNTSVNDMLEALAEAYGFKSISLSPSAVLNLIKKAAKAPAAYDFKNRKQLDSNPVSVDLNGALRLAGIHEIKYALPYFFELDGEAKEDLNGNNDQENLAEAVNIFFNLIKVPAPKWDWNEIHSKATERAQKQKAAVEAANMNQFNQSNTNQVSNKPW